MKILCRFILEDKRRLILDITALEVLKDRFFSETFRTIYIHRLECIQLDLSAECKLNQLAFRQLKFKCVRNFQLAPNMSRHVALSR